jgi:hypothetical protein
LTSKGRCKVTAALTATSRSREAMYCSVLLNAATPDLLNQAQSVGAAARIGKAWRDA